MSGRKAKEQRRLQRAAGEVMKPEKVPTPVLLRSSSWRERVVQVKGMPKRQVRAGRVAVRQGVMRDLGWGKPSLYLTLRGKLTKRAEVGS